MLIIDCKLDNLRSTLSGAVQSIMCVRFSPNDELVLGASSENSVLLWGVQNGRIRVDFDLLIVT